MNLKLEIFLLLIGGFLRIGCVFVNIWYYFTQTFSTPLLHTLCGSFIVAPSAVFLLITMILIIRDCCKGTFGRILFKLGIGLLISIGGPLGIPLFFYAVLLATTDSNEGDFFIIEGLSRATSLIEAIFESIPQIGIQIYNNLYSNDWTPLKISSVTLSGLGIAYTCYKLCYAVDKITHYEQSISHAKVANVESKTLSDRKIQDIEIYDASDSNNN